MLRLLPFLIALPASAAQVILLDVQYTHTSDNRAINRPFGSWTDSLRGSHAYFALASTQPSNFVTPIDYRNGHFAVVIDVISKPTSQRMLWGGCAVQGNATCFGYVSITTPGRYVQTFPVSNFWQVSAVDWTRTFQSMPSIFRDQNEKKLDLGQGFLGEPSFANYYPLELRVRVYAVSAGATFMPPPNATSDAGVMVDAGQRIDAGTLPIDAGAAFDAGRTLDAGVSLDAGTPFDAGTIVDAGVPGGDGGLGDAGVIPADAGRDSVDAGAQSVGAGRDVEPGCSAAPWVGAWSVVLVLLRLGRRR